MLVQVVLKTSAECRGVAGNEWVHCLCAEREGPSSCGLLGHLGRHCYPPGVKAEGATESQSCQRFCLTLPQVICSGDWTTLWTVSSWHTHTRIQGKKNGQQTTISWHVNRVPKATQKRRSSQAKNGRQRWAIASLPLLLPLPPLRVIVAVARMLLLHLWIEPFFPFDSFSLRL